MSEKLVLCLSRCAFPDVGERELLSHRFEEKENNVELCKTQTKIDQ